MNIKIRDYKKSDFAEIYNLWKETGLASGARGDSENVIHDTLNSGGRLIVLEDETEKIIGTTWITNDARRLYQHHFAIKPGFQGRGYAKLLAAESLRYAKKMNMQMKLEVHKDNQVAIALYKKIGFRYLGDYHVYIIREPEKIVI